VNKHKFIEFVEKPSSIREKDTDILSELARNYPYASLVRSMLAKAMAHTPEAKASLATAALFIPDRKVLKAVMEDKLDKPSARQETSFPETDPRTNLKDSTHTAQKPEPTATLPKITETEEQETQQLSKVPHNVVDELQENLRQLRAQRMKFEQQDHTPEHSKNKQSSTASGTVIPSHLPERLQELLLNKEELPIDDPKRIEQINLIDSFIQNSSAISRKYRTLDNADETQNDLSSKEYNTPQDLVTENLAQIMVRQGKTEKAIDIYEKLILKYPKKSAYFASCIEKLKTSL
jgi:tetratricopeptide (TPR) repeat protein